MTNLTLRNEQLPRLVEILKEQADARYDVVAPASKLSFADGNLMVATTGEATLTPTGVTPPRDVEMCLEPTPIFDAGLSDRLGIPLKYLRRMRDENQVPLLDHNVNAWLQANPGKQWFVRGFKADDDTCGIARAFLSDRYGCIDHYDVLLTVLGAIKDMGIDTNIVGADLSESRMSVRVQAPSVAMLAPELLANYRSPYTGKMGADNPLVFAGFVISNSETGGGAFTITPRLIVEVCTNGMTMTRDALRKVHLGSKMEEGQIRWSDETQRRNLDLVKSQTADAVRTFLDVDYIRTKVNEVTALAGAPVDDAAAVVTEVSKACKFTEDEQAGILNAFIKGGDTTSGGVMQAVTAFAQTIDDPDRANEVEEQGIPALEAAHALVSA